MPRGWGLGERPAPAHASIRRCLAGAALAALASGGVASGAERVVGGSPIQVQAAPWAVVVQDQTATTRYLCSGSIVDASHIVTAAHCVFDDSGTIAQPSQLTVEAGVSNFSAPLPTDLEQQRTVSSFRVGPGYVWSSQLVPDDVAVLALSSPLDLSGPAAQAVALPAPTAPFPAGALVGLAGFGDQTSGVFATGPLESMTATVDAQGSCGSTTNGGVLADDAIRLCASSPSSATCNGDSGAGLVTTGANPTLVGVVSGGPPGCVLGSQTVYTYVGAPEILSFVQGDEQPPTAPSVDASTFVDLTWEQQPLVVGDTLSCSSGDWAGGQVSLSYSFVTGSGQVLQTGARATYTLRPADVGATVSCRVAATNAGGTAVDQTAATPVIKPAAKVKTAKAGPAASGGSDATLASSSGRHADIERGARGLRRTPRRPPRQ